MLVCIVHVSDLLGGRNKSISWWDTFQSLTQHVLASLLTKFALWQVYLFFAASISHIQGLPLLFEWVLVNGVVHFLHTLNIFLIDTIFIRTSMVSRNRFKTFMFFVELPRNKIKSFLENLTLLHQGFMGLWAHQVDLKLLGIVRVYCRCHNLLHGFESRNSRTHIWHCLLRKGRNGLFGLAKGLIQTHLRMRLLFWVDIG